MGAASAGPSSGAVNVSVVRPRLSVTRPAARPEARHEPAALAVLDWGNRCCPGDTGLAAGDGEQAEPGRAGSLAQPGTSSWPASLGATLTSGFWSRGYGLGGRARIGETAGVTAGNDGTAGGGAGMAAGHGQLSAGSPGRPSPARPSRISSPREAMPSLRNTLRRWWSTVRGLMNSWAAAWRLVAPPLTAR